MVNTTSLWEKTRQILSQQTSPTWLRIWFSKTEVVNVGKQDSAFQVRLASPNKFLTEQVEKRCAKPLISALEMVLGQKVNLELVVAKNGAVVPETLGKNLTDSSSPNGQAQKEGPAFLFENFVVGESNKLAYSASLAVANNPGVSYNPLFVFGGTGLGKTHLLAAIANHLAKNSASLKVVYRTTEAFTNEFIASLVEGSLRFFREKYRKLDVLLIDDVQFLSGKQSTQDEFFHTFNEIHSAHHQIVLTSDRHPSEIGKLEERLVSRFLGGLTCDIAPPELELKMAILTKKAALVDLNLETGVVEFLAKILTNPREIEGAIATIAQFIKSGGVVNLESVKSLFGKRPQIRAVPKQVTTAVARFYQLKSQELISKVRKKEIVKARQMVMFLLREELGLSFEFIGQILGSRDHSTVIHGVANFKKGLSVDSNLREDLLAVKGSLAL